MINIQKSTQKETGKTNQFIENGISYKKSAINGYSSGKFNKELTYSTILMSIENYLVGFLENTGIVPLSHTFTELTGELLTTGIITGEFASEIKKIDEHFNLCSLDPFQMPVINDDLIHWIFTIADNLGKLHK